MTSRRHAAERQHFGIRLSPEAIALIEGLAKESTQAEGSTVNKSEQARRMLAFAALKMPKGWKPTTKNPGDLV